MSKYLLLQNIISYATEYISQSTYVNIEILLLLKREHSKIIPFTEPAALWQHNMATDHNYCCPSAHTKEENLQSATPQNICSRSCLQVLLGKKRNNLNTTKNRHDEANPHSRKTKKKKYSKALNPQVETKEMQMCPVRGFYLCL